MQFSIRIQFEYKYTIKLTKSFRFQAIQFSQNVLIQTIQISFSMQFTYQNSSISSSCLA